MGDVERRTIYVKCNVCSDEYCIAKVPAADYGITMDSCLADGTDAVWQEITREEFLEEI